MLPLAEAKWDDRVVDDEEIEQVNKNIALINTKDRGTVWIAYGPYKFLTDFTKKVEASGFCDAHQLFVYKIDQDARGVNCYIHAVEPLVVAYKGGRSACTLNFPNSNPRARHNLVFTLANRLRLTMSGGSTPVNISEKPA